MRAGAPFTVSVIPKIRYELVSRAQQSAGLSVTHFPCQLRQLQTANKQSKKAGTHNFCNDHKVEVAVKLRRAMFRLLAVRRRQRLLLLAAVVIALYGAWRWFNHEEGEFPSSESIIKSADE